MSWSFEITFEKYELLQYLIGFSVEENFQYVMRDALNNDAYWSPEDVLELAEHCDERWGTRLVKLCKEMQEASE
tara:strand:- start:1624 stop:1845 length:222 start_codon:yes stop_codon:yes gene_type:complete